MAQRDLTAHLGRPAKRYLGHSRLETLSASDKSGRRRGPKHEINPAVPSTNGPGLAESPDDALQSVTPPRRPTRRQVALLTVDRELLGRLRAVTAPAFSGGALSEKRHFCRGEHAALGAVRVAGHEQTTIKGFSAWLDKDRRAGGT